MKTKKSCKTCDTCDKAWTDNCEREKCYKHDYKYWTPEQTEDKKSINLRENNNVSISKH